MTTMLKPPFLTTLLLIGSSQLSLGWGKPQHQQRQQQRDRGLSNTFEKLGGVEGLGGGGGSSGFLRESDLPDTGEEWISLTKDTEFLPASSSSSAADAADFSPMTGSSSSSASSVSDSEHVRRAQRRFLGYEDKFADGNTYYDEYAQAWRVLGWYVDCSPVSDDHRRRRLSRRRRREPARRRLEEGDEGDEDGEEDGEDEYDDGENDDDNYNNAADAYDYYDDDGNKNNDDEQQASSYCMRYLLWAAVRFPCFWLGYSLVSPHFV